MIIFCQILLAKDEVHDVNKNISRDIFLMVDNKMHITSLIIKAKKFKNKIIL